MCPACTAKLAIPPALEDPTDQNSDAARELQIWEGEQWLQSLPVVGAHPFGGQHCGKEHFTQEQR